VVFVLISLDGFLFFLVLGLGCHFLCVHFTGIFLRGNSIALCIFVYF
jgi:hypothetical protein